VRPTRTASLSTRQALFERSKPFVSAAGPVAVFETSFARVGVGGARFAARRHGEVFRRASAWAKGAGARGGDLSGASRRGRGRSAARSQPGVVAMCSSARVGVGEGAVACRSTARRRGGVFLGTCRRGRRRGGLQLYELRAAWGATGQLAHCHLARAVDKRLRRGRAVPIFI